MAGHDLMYGGDDWVSGNARNDILTGDPGTDTLIGGPGYDVCYAGAQQELVAGDFRFGRNFSQGSTE
jgi:Ca2+-binding RTX toxin-like protein